MNLHFPVIQGIIDRRILANYRIEPNVLQKHLPAPFRPKLVNGWGIAGVCLIRLMETRPRFIPAGFGFSSENAAHRIAVEWDKEGQTHQGVYVPRRDTSSRLNSAIGGRVFTGVHHHAHFTVNEQNSHYSVKLDSDDNTLHMHIKAQETDTFPTTSVFPSLQAVSDFFEAGSLGYSPAKGDTHFDGLELDSFRWQVSPLDVTHIASSFFDDGELFPAGSIQFDCALLMQNIPHQWRARPSLSQMAYS